MGECWTIKYFVGKNKNCVQLRIKVTFVCKREKKGSITNSIRSIVSRQCDIDKTSEMDAFISRHIQPNTYKIDGNSDFCQNRLLTLKQSYV